MSLYVSMSRPPCTHVSIKDVEDQAVTRRKQLPLYKGGMTCHFYLKHGYCRNFNQYGSCSLNHPRNLHKIASQPVRCPQCSLVWPCHHCSFSPHRDIVLATVMKLQARFHLLKQIAVEAPPIALTSHLVSACIVYSISHIASLLIRHCKCDTVIFLLCLVFPCLASLPLYVSPIDPVIILSGHSLPIVLI